MKLSQVIEELKAIASIRSDDPEVMIDPSPPGDMCQSIKEIVHIEGYEVSIVAQETVWGEDD